jgi:hypothetical protein
MRTHIFLCVSTISTKTINEIVYAHSRARVTMSDVYGLLGTYNGRFCFIFHRQTHTHTHNAHSTFTEDFHHLFDLSLSLSLSFFYSLTFIYICQSSSISFDIYFLFFFFTVSYSNGVYIVEKLAPLLCQHILPFGALRIFNFAANGSCDLHVLRDLKNILDISQICSVRAPGSIIIIYDTSNNNMCIRVI